MGDARRRFLKSSATVVASAALPLSSHGQTQRSVAQEMGRRLKHLVAPAGTPPDLLASPSPPLEPFNEITLELAHDGSTHLYYEGLIHDQVVLIASMSIKHDRHYPCTSRLRKIRDLLDTMHDTKVNLLSISVDPDHDTPGRLADYAVKIAMLLSRTTFATGIPGCSQAT